MGRKKPSSRGNEDLRTGDGGGVGVAAANKVKNKKPIIDDDEYSVVSDLSEEQPKPEEEQPPGAAVAIAGKKKKKNNNNKAQIKGEDDEEKSINFEEYDDAPPPPVVFTGKKKSKSKKGGMPLSASSFDVLEEEEIDDDGERYKKEEETDEEETLAKKKKNNKSSSSFKKGGSSSLFAALDGDGDGEEDVDGDGEEDENKEEEEDVITFSGKKKKSSKSSKKGKGGSSSLFAALDDDGEEDEYSKHDNDNDDDDENKEDVDGDGDLITFSGKKKKKKSKSSKSLFGTAALLDNEEADQVSQPYLTTTGSGSGSGDGEEESEAAELITFTGKKKSSKFKKNNSLSSTTHDLDNETDVRGTGHDDPKNVNVVGPSSTQGSNTNANAMAETSKNKKKKKKGGGRTVQEEDDLDRILAELGEGLSASANAPPQPTIPPPQEEKLPVQPDPVGQVDGTGEEKEVGAETAESAAAKKKKKKKEKEKEKKAATAGTASAVQIKEEKKAESTSKVSDKKVPKHVREMQEALARRKEAEERQKKEEEERLRKEEEERRRQEELERQEEEKRRRKKEREKEKLLKKKQEGKLLTAKQKEEARRLEAMKKQFLASGVVLPPPDSSNATKRPKYHTKKSKPTSAQQNGEPPVKAVDDLEEKANQPDAVNEENSTEVGKVQEVEPVGTVDATKSGDEPGVEENGNEEEDDDDEEWDAKSWDDAVVKLSAESPFAEEEVESEPEAVPMPVVKKDTKRVTLLTPGDAGAPPAATKPTVNTQDIELESKEDQHDVEVTDNKSKRKDAASKREARAMEAHSKRSADNLRSPICCIMGHVDTGKTKLLDCIRGTNVQEGEAGGITQQIGATYFPAENIRERTKELKADAKLQVPGLLVIDTPGHESFTNLRSRGSGLCDIAILVVDIMHGLEPQTIESLNLLKMRKTKFIVALNKVDRLYGWKICPNSPIVKAMKQQSNDVQNEFKMRLTQIVTQFKEQGLNTELYYKNKDKEDYFNIVPTSAISGEGIPDLLLLLVQWTQRNMVEKLMFSTEIQCTVLEVKVIEGLGTTIDVVLVNGALHEGDQIVVCGMQGPIVTTIRALLTPHPMKELRVKGTYEHHKEIKAAQGIKITAQGLEHAIAGTSLYVVGPEDDLEDIKETTMQDMKSVMNRIDRSGEGVCVQASTLGSLEALLEFLKSPAVNIPVSGISIGPVHKKDVMKASVMLERKKEFATILAFDVKVTPEARELADETGVKIFIADIIYHLFDQFKAYIDNLKEEKKKEAAEEAVFPCVLKIMPNCVFNKKDPIVLGVDVLEGIAKVGTPICIPSREFIDIGRIASIEINHKQVDIAKKSQKVAIKIASTNPEEQQKMYGRHFEIDDELVSHISRKSIDVLKANYRDDLSIEEWKLVVKLKNLFGIQ